MKDWYLWPEAPTFSNSLSMHYSVTKKILYNYCIIAQKCLMLKQGIQTINTKFIQLCPLSQLFFVQFRPYATSFPGLLLPLTLMPKGRKTLEKSLDLKPSFKISVDCWRKGRGSCFERGLSVKLVLYFYSK